VQQRNQSIIDTKITVVNEVKEKLESSASSVVVEYRGLSVKEITELRRALLKDGIDFKVYKNSMVERAANDLGYSALTESLTGPNAFAFSKDAVAPARVLAKFAKKHEFLVLKGGVVEGKVVDVATIKVLASLPGREGMISMILGMLQSPVRKFAYAISQVAEQKQA
jgi:large subunit ribosomal protein L10